MIFLQSYRQNGSEAPSSGSSPYKNLYSDEGRVIFIKNAKVMSTSSKLIVDALRNDGVVPSIVPHVHDLPYLAQLPDSEQDLRLDSYHRVVFIRNPYARLYSAWTNKFRDMPSTCRNLTERGRTRMVCDMYYRHWVEMSVAVLEALDLEVPDNAQDILREVTWPRFIQAVVTGDVYDTHWALQVRGVAAAPCVPRGHNLVCIVHLHAAVWSVCRWSRPQSREVNLCKFNPTFIGSQEHSDSDLQALFVILAKTSEVAAKLSSQQFRANTSKGSTGVQRPRTNYTELFPPDVKRKVDKMFADDFRAFGYSTDLSCVH